MRLLLCLTDHVTELEPGCAFDSGGSSGAASARSSRASSVDSACCDRLCTNVSVVSELVERSSRRDAAAAAAGVFNDASSSLLSPGEHLSAVFDSDSEPSPGAADHIEREYSQQFDFNPGHLPSPSHD